MSATSRTTDVTILGAGIVGVCCALEAQERGLSVTVVDRLPPGEATSHGNAGVISPWSVVPQAMPGVWKQVPRWLLDPKGPVKLRWRDLPQILPWVWSFMRCSRLPEVHRVSDAMQRLQHGNVERYRAHLKGTGHEDLITDAMNVTVYRGDAKPSLGELGHALRVEHGCDVELIGAGDLRDLEPALSDEYHSAALIKGQARARDPGKLCKVLAEKAARQGAEFLRADVTAILPQPDGSVSLQSSDGEITARKLILAGGIWSAGLLKPLGIRLPLMAERGYHLEFSDPGVDLNNSIQDAAGKVIVSSMNNGVRIAGTAEFAHVDAPPNYARAKALAPLAKRLMPDLNLTPVREWMGIRPSFPDNLPAIGALPGHPNLIAAFGHSHYGLGMAPGTGRFALDAVLQERTNRAFKDVAPMRFSD